MPTLENKKLARCLQIATLLMPIIALAWLLNPQAQNVQTAIAAAPVAVQAEKKVTIEGVDSTRIQYEFDDESTLPGIFRSDPSNDDRDTAIRSKIKSLRVLLNGNEVPGSLRTCAPTVACSVIVNTNRGPITVRDAGNNTVSLTYDDRHTYRYSCRGSAAHSKRVNVQNVRLANPDRTINCPGNKCSTEITYDVQ